MPAVGRQPVQLPMSRHSSGTGNPASTRLSASMTWLSVNLDFFM
jgi:hypothetical protein